MRLLRSITAGFSFVALVALAAASWVGPCATAAESRAVAAAIDDFEDLDLGSPPGKGWFGVADDQMGGASRVRLEPLDPGADGSRGALRVSGRTVAGDGGSFAGAWTALAPDGGAADLTGVAAIRFRARGDGGGYTVQVRCVDGGRFAHFTAPFTAGPEWARFEIPLADLEQTFPPAPPYEWTGRDAVALGFVADGAREFAFDLDGVELVAAAAAALGPVRTAGTRGRVTTIEIAPLAAAGADGWLSLGAEPEADGRLASLPDLRELLVRYDPAERRVWFRLVLHGEPPADWFGLNLALDVDGDSSNGTAWWNVNKEFRFDRLVTVWVNRTGSVYQGAVGVADAEAVAGFTLDNLDRDLRVARDPEGRSLAVGVPLTALGDGRSLALIATVGSSLAPNDDLPDRGSIRLDLGRLIRREKPAP